MRRCRPLFPFKDLSRQHYVINRTLIFIAFQSSGSLYQIIFKKIQEKVLSGKFVVTDEFIKYLTSKIVK